MIYLDKKIPHEIQLFFLVTQKKSQSFQESRDLQTYLCSSLRDYFIRDRFQGETRYFKTHIVEDFHPAFHGDALEHG